MIDEIRAEYDEALKKRDELRAELNALETEKEKSHYKITVARDRLAFWEGKVEGLKFALDRIDKIESE